MIDFIIKKPPYDLTSNAGLVLLGGVQTAGSSRWTD